MSETDWKLTSLWQELEGRESAAESTRNYVRNWLDEVQVLLAKGGTAPPNFTLHDDEHSFRVAQRMAQLIPTATMQKLSDYEIALTSYSAGG